MPGNITLSLDPSGVIDSLDKYQKNVIRNMVGLVRSYIKKAELKLKTQHMSGRGTNSVGVVTGKLRRSVKSIPPVFIGDEILGGINIGNAETPYADTHIGVRGSTVTITPKTKMALAIPLPLARTAGGVPRGGPRDPIWGATFIMQGIIWGFQRGTKREYARPMPLFALKQSVVVRRRIDPDVDIVQFFKPQMEAEAKQILESASVVGGKVE